MSYQDLDLRQDTQYNLVFNKQKTLNTAIYAYYMSGDTEVGFDFATLGYTAATMQVRMKPNAPFVVLEFSTTDGSIVLPTSGSTFQLIKTAAEMSVVRAGEYYYDMYLSSPAYPKRAFLSGVCTIIPNITT